MIYPELKAGGYNERFAVGLIASSGAIAVVIPPSIAMILYAVSAEQSAVLLFTAGILPSILIGIIDATFVMSYAKLKRVPLGTSARWETVWKTTKEASWSIGSLAVIFGGIYGGVFTPTEAAGVAVDLFAIRDHGRLPRSRSRWVLAYPAGVRLSHLANPSHRDLCWNLFVVADDQWNTATGRRSDQCTAHAEVGVAA